MCDATSALMMAAGTGLNMAGNYMTTRNENRNNERMQKARENAYRQGMDRQRAYADEASAAFNQSLSNQGTTGFDTAFGNNQSSRNSALTGAVVDQGDYRPFAASTPKNVLLAVDNASQEARDKATDNASRLATLGAYGDAMFDMGLDRNDYARAFSNLTDTAQRDANLINMDMNAAASNAYEPTSAWASTLAPIGSAMSMYGAAGTPGIGMQTVPRPNDAFVGPMQQTFQVGAGSIYGG